MPVSWGNELFSTAPKKAPKIHHPPVTFAPKMSQHEAHHHHEHGQGHDHHDHHAHHAQMVKEFKTKFWICLLLTLPILVLAPMIQDALGYSLSFPYSDKLLAGLATIVFFYGGWPFLKGLWDEVKGRKPGMMTLIAVAISVAWLYSSAVTLGLPGKTFFWELASLIVIMLLGHWIEMKSVMGASNALEKLAELMPDEATRLKEDGSTETVKVSELENEDRILVRPGEKVPADGTIEEGESSVDESMLTGESVPVKKSEEEELIGGSVNGEGSLTVRVKHAGDASYLSKVIGMVRKAGEDRSKTQHLADRAALWLTIISLGVGTATLIVWWGIMKVDFVVALERMVTVMVISCPHALGLAIPLVAAISTAVSARNGLLIRDRTAFEDARKIDTVLFDKTGTLTTGAFSVKKMVSLHEGWDEADILQKAASLEQHSEHPLAKGILASAEEKESALEKVEGMENITGEGIKGRIDGTEYHLVGPGWLEKRGIVVPDVDVGQGVTKIHLVKDDTVIGVIGLSDTVRESSKSAIEKLQASGISCIMITGDNAEVAEAVSKELGMDDFFAGVLPDEKLEKVKELQKQGKRVAMTGDGVNDAPALAQADVGIAVGSGTDVAAETAHVVLVNSDPMDVTNVILFGKATHRKMIENLFWATAYNAIAIPLAAGVLYKWGITVSPATGAVVMSLSTVVVAINAQLLKGKLEG